MQNWLSEIEDDKLRKELVEYIKSNEQSEAILYKLHQYYTSDKPAKKRKLNIPSEAISLQVEAQVTYPIRKKMTVLLYERDFGYRVCCKDGDGIVADIEATKVLCLRAPTASMAVSFTFCSSSDFVSFVVAKDFVSFQQQLTISISTTDYFNKTNDGVPCHIGSKDGVLYLLKDAIFFGYKKPLLYIKHSQIESMQVIGMTSRMFDVQVEVKDQKPVVFTMLDKQVHARFVQYIESKRLNVGADSRLQALDYDEEADEDYQTSSSSGDDEEDSESESSGSGEE